MDKIRKHLLEKGWNKREIEKAIKIINHTKKNKHPKIKLLDKAVYWFSLLVAVIGNFLILVTLMPFILTLHLLQLFPIAITLGVSFGLLFELLVRGIENLETKHHLFFGTIIPIIAVINFVVISNLITIFTGIEVLHNTLIIGSVYAIAFILPYVLYRLFLKNK
jgi:hypothetical protein